MRVEHTQSWPTASMTCNNMGYKAYFYPYEKIWKQRKITRYRAQTVGSHSTVPVISFICFSRSDKRDYPNPSTIIRLRKQHRLRRRSKHTNTQPLQAWPVAWGGLFPSSWRFWGGMKIEQAFDINITSGRETSKSQSWPPRPQCSTGHHLDPRRFSSYTFILCLHLCQPCRCPHCCNRPRGECSLPRPSPRPGLSVVVNLFLLSVYRLSISLSFCLSVLLSF